jgi:hypothetical protein
VLCWGSANGGQGVGHMPAGEEEERTEVATTFGPVFVPSVPLPCRPPCPTKAHG